MKSDYTNCTLFPCILQDTMKIFIGILFFYSFGFIDTYFVSLLGTKQLAAITYTFPMVNFVSCVIMGLATGVTTNIAKRQVTKDSINSGIIMSLVFMFLTFILISVLGILSIDYLAYFIGARGDQIREIASYMTAWYLGLILLAPAITISQIFTAKGKMKEASIVMVSAGLFNILLDPIFIFGKFGITVYGMKGAAIASAIASIISFIIGVVLLLKDNFKIEAFKLNDLVDHSKKVLFIGVPASVNFSMAPISIAIIIKILSSQLPISIPAYGVAHKVEAILSVFAISLSAVMIPFMSQNKAAGHKERLVGGLRQVAIICSGWGGFLLIFLGLGAPYISKVFTNDVSIIMTASFYLAGISFFLGPISLSIVSTGMLNALEKPYHSLGLNFVRVFVLAVPMVIIGIKNWAFVGLVYSLMVAYLLSGLYSYWYVRKQIN